MPDSKELARQARNEYNRRWYAGHKEQRKASRERYWERKAKKMLAEKEAAQDERTKSIQSEADGASVGN